MCLLSKGLFFLFTDGSDGTWHHKHHKHHSNHKHHRQHHTRQRRQEWSPSQAIHEKRKEGSVRSEITFGHETQAAEEWVFLTRNATTVKAHIGSTAILPCEVKKESQFGMVRFFQNLFSCTDRILFLWSEKSTQAGVSVNTIWKGKVWLLDMSRLENTPTFCVEIAEFKVEVAELSFY